MRVIPSAHVCLGLLRRATGSSMPERFRADVGVNKR
jgi:hypothetical protein